MYGMYNSDTSSDNDSQQSNRRSVCKKENDHGDSVLIFSYCICLRSLQKDQFLWDSFQDPPAPLHSGSALDNKRFDRLKKLLKIVTYMLVFVVVLCGAIASKMSYLLMVTFVSNGQRVKYCDVNRKRNCGIGFMNLFLVTLKMRLSILGPDRELYALQSNNFRIAWTWMLCIAYIVPEMGTLLRAARICFFRNIRKCLWSELGLVCHGNAITFSFWKLLFFTPISLFVSCGHLNCCMCWA